MTKNKGAIPSTIPLTKVAQAQTVTSTHKMTPEQIRDLVKNSASVKNPVGRGSGEMSNETPISLKVTDIDFCDRNPRVEKNPRYADLKESIRAIGLKQNFSVTKRPGQERYMIEGGGNTRLAILKELFQETGDKRFEYVEVMYRKYVSEAALIVAHLAENETQGEMTFWDKAKGALDVKAELEKIANNKLSLRELEIEMRKLGLPIGKSLLAVYKFSIENLEGLSTRLSRFSLLTIQPKFNQFLKLIEKANRQPDQFQKEVYLPAQSEYVMSSPEGESLDIDAFHKIVEGRLAAWLNEPASLIPFMLSRLHQFPESTYEELRNAPPSSTPAIIATTQNDITVPTGTVPVTDTLKDVEQSSQGDGTEGKPTPYFPPQSIRNSLENTALKLGQQTIARRQAGFDEATDTSFLTPQSSVDEKIAQLKFKTLQAAEIVSKTVGLDHLFKLAPDMPFGFYMELPADNEPALISIEDGTGDGSEQFGYWALANVSRQREEICCRNSVPKESLWRQMMLQENGYTAADFELTIHSKIGASSQQIDIAQFVYIGPVVVAALRMLTCYHDAMNLQDEVHGLPTKERS